MYYIGQVKEVLLVVFTRATKHCWLSFSFTP